MRRLRSPRAQVAVVAVAAILPYLGLLGQPLVYDAPRAILDNPSLAAGSLPGVFAVDFWGLPPDAEFASRSYRPLVSATWWLGLRAFGDSPAGFHALDVLLHAAAAGLVVVLARRLGVGGAWPVAAGLVYALHPVQTEAVASVVGRADLLAAALMLGGLVLHLGASRNGLPGARRHLAETGAVLCLGAALLAKEYAVAFPFVLVAVDLGMRAAGRRRRGLPLGTWAAAFALLAGYLGLRLALFGALGGVPMLTEVDHPLVGQPFGVRAATAARLAALAARILVWPAWPSHHYRAGTLPIVESLADPRALGGLALLAAIVGAAAWALGRRRDPVPWTAAALFVLPLAPGLNLAGPGGVLFAERFLVLPCAGLALVVAHAAALLARRGRRAAVATVVVVALAAAAAAGRTAARVEDWSSDERLARSSIAAWPGSHETWRDLGLALAGAGREAEAVEALERATALEPRDAQSWHALAEVLTRAGRYAEAAEAWRRTVEAAPVEAPVLWSGLGRALVQAGDLEGAVAALERARALAPEDASARALLAGALLDLAGRRLATGAPAEALEAARRSVALEMLPARGWLAAALIAEGAGEPATARAWLDRGLTLDPRLAADPRARDLLARPR